MKKRDWTLLFSEYSLHENLAAQLSGVSARVRQVSPDRFKNESDEFIAASVASMLVVKPIELAEDEIEVSTRDADVDVSHDMHRAVIDRSVPAFVHGKEVTYHLPFIGDKALFRCQPNTYTSMPPRAVVSGSELTFPYERPGEDIATTKPEFFKDLQELKRWVGWVNDQVSGYNGMLESSVRRDVVARRSEIERTEDQTASLGFKVRKEGSTGPIQSGSSNAARETHRAEARERVNKTYDVALSFAGEDRVYVEAVADALKKLNVSLFYDRFEQVELWGKNLPEELGRVYGKDSRFVVMFISKFYVSKGWPTHEKRFALAREIQCGGEIILPVRFDDVDLPGLPPGKSFLDLRAISPSKLAELIRQKVDA